MSTHLPYAGTSGHSGSATSRDRAEREDATGVTGKRQKDVIKFLSAMEKHGGTCKEVSTWLSIHHGQSSGVLSVLHKERVIARLKATRNRCAIYVLPEFILGREMSPRKVRTCSNCGHSEE